MARAEAERSSSGRRVLITGGTGLIGSALCRRLAAAGDEVTVLARPSSDRGRLAGAAGRLSVVTADITDLGQVAAIVEQAAPQAVFHLACSTFNPPTLTPADHLDVNVRGTLALLEALKARRDCRLVYTGSAAEYPPGNGLTEDAGAAPVNVYGAMKACASVLIGTYARMYGLRTSRAVLFTVYGPGEAAHRLVSSTVRAALEGRTVTLKDGAVQRDMLYLDDAVEGLCRMAAADLAPGLSINLCSGAGLTVRHIAEEILRLMGSSVSIEERPAERRPDEITIVSGDNGRARALLGWRPQWTLESGLRESIAWARTQGQPERTRT